MKRYLLSSRRRVVAIPATWFIQTPFIHLMLSLGHDWTNRSSSREGTSENSFSLDMALMEDKVCSQLRNALWVIICSDTLGIEEALNKI